jgi:uncharacterized protein
VTNEWPVDTLNVDSLVAAGWSAKPFQQFILKLHGRCNLSCDYCYMYQFSDQLLLSQSRAMPSALIRQSCRRIAEHVTRHGLTRIEVSLHGGEPLLAGSSGLVSVVTELRHHIPDTTVVDLVMTTNGILLTEAILDLLLEHNIHVGVSLDGSEETHDKHRRYRDGRGSYDKVVAGLGLLTSDRYRTLFAGLLCVIDVEEDPLSTYESLLKFAPPSVDFLLPHGNWTDPPPRWSDDEASYGRWLITVFDRWFDVPEQETEVRLFAEIINLILGGQSRTESVGTSPVALITVNTDGSMEQVDTLRSAYPGAPTTGLNILTNSFDDALHHPAVVARQIGMAALADACQQCEIVRICGGGHYAHRYRQGSGFRNQSVYCADLTLLINHIADRLRRALTEDITSQEARYHSRPDGSPSRPPSPGGSHPAGA